MHPGPLFLVLAMSCLAPGLHAETSSPLPAAPSASAPQIDALQQRLAESEQARAELTAQLDLAGSGERESAQLSRLRQEAQRLKLQLKEAQAGQAPRLFNEQQLWFAIGAAVTLVAALLGALLRGQRSSRRAWSN